MAQRTLVLVTALCAGACTLHAAPGAPPTYVNGVDDTADLIEALRATGARIEAGGVIEQPFMPVPGNLLVIDGAETQVFEFRDTAARARVSRGISFDGRVIGGARVTWIARPVLWARGRLIVLHAGGDPDLIARLSAELGAPIAVPGPAPQAEPVAAGAAARELARQLEVPSTRVEVVRAESASWPDACLGLRRPGETCAQVVTPGWRILLRADRDYREARTDQTGRVVRLERRPDVEPW